MRDGGVEADVLLDIEVLNIVVEVLGDLRVVWEDRVVVWHGIIRKLHTRLRRIDEEGFIAARHTIDVLINPISANFVASLITIEGDTMLLQNLTSGNPR